MLLKVNFFPLIDSARLFLKAPVALSKELPTKQPDSPCTNTQSITPAPEDILHQRACTWLQLNRRPTVTPSTFSQVRGDISGQQKISD
jgi:hypothetical protein